MNYDLKGEKIDLVRLEDFDFPKYFRDTQM